MSGTEILYSWLRDAHGMEKAIGDYTEKSIKDFKDNEKMQHKLREISTQNKAAIETIEKLLEERGNKSSTGKDLLGNALGFFSGAGSSAFRDGGIKNILVIHGAYHFAHACYISLSEAANTCDDSSLALMCSQLADERRAIAEWAEDNIPLMTEHALLVD